MSRPKTLSAEERKRRDAEAKAAWRRANPGYSAAWYSANKDSVKQRAAAWHASNPEKALACRVAWRQENTDKARSASANWRRANRGVAAALAAGYRARKLRATPGWADMGAIEEFYREAAARKLHVDHIVPLRGRVVSGLHVLNNLQMLTKSENSKKHNHFEEA